MLAEEVLLVDFLGFGDFFFVLSTTSQTTNSHK